MLDTIRVHMRLIPNQLTAVRFAADPQPPAMIGRSSGSYSPLARLRSDCPLLTRDRG